RRQPARGERHGSDRGDRPGEAGRREGRLSQIVDALHDDGPRCSRRRGGRGQSVQEGSLAMPTQEKITEVADLKTKLDGVKTVVLTEYRGLTVQELSELRKQLRAVSAQYKVVKNRLARLAIESSTLEGLGTHLKGPTAVILSKEDPVAVAKALHAFARAHQALAIKAGYVEGPMLPPPELKAPAGLPSAEGLRGLLGGGVPGGRVALVLPRA